MDHSFLYLEKRYVQEKELFIYSACQSPWQRLMEIAGVKVAIGNDNCLHRRKTIVVPNIPDDIRTWMPSGVFGS